MIKNDLDEMQVQKRNRIGTQSFLLLTYLLTLDILLNGIGITLVQYPVNITIIILLCASFYFTRAILANAFIGPRSNAGRCQGKLTVILTACAVCIAMLSLILGSKGISGLASTKMRSVDSIVLQVVLVLSIAVPLFSAGVLRWRMNGKDEE